MSGNEDRGVAFNLARVSALVLTSSGVLATCTFLTFAVSGYLIRKNVSRKFYLLLISRSVADLIVLLIWPFTSRGFYAANTKLSTLLLPAIINTPHQAILLGTNLTLTGVKNLAITRPLFYRQWVTIGKIGTIVGVIWLIGVLSAVPAIELVMKVPCFSNGTELSCNWTRSLNTYITIVVPSCCVIAYLTNVIGSVVLWTSLNNGLKNRDIRRSVSQKPLGAVMHPSAKLFSSFVVKWSIVNYAVFCFPSSLYRVCGLATALAMHLRPHHEVDVVNVFGGFERLMTTFAVLNYLSLVGGIVRIVLDALLPFVTSVELRAACSELFTLGRSQGVRPRRLFRHQSTASASTSINTMTTIDSGETVKISVTSF